MPRIELRGDDVVKAPETRGLYAWYYAPLRPKDDHVVTTWSRLMSSNPIIQTRIQQRYGIQYISRSQGNTVIGSEDKSLESTIREGRDQAPEYFESLLNSEAVLSFCRPIYIGIAKNLRKRLYDQHYLSLIEYWDDESQVGKFLKTQGPTTLQELMNKLDLNHSFALEARVIGISPHDLIATAFPSPLLPDAIGADTDNGSDTKERRALERLLQLLADPACGRR